MLAAGEAARFLIHSLFFRFSPQTICSPANRLNVAEILPSAGRQFRPHQVFTGNEVRLQSGCGVDHIFQPASHAASKSMPDIAVRMAMPIRLTAHAEERALLCEIGCRQALKRRSKFCQSRRESLRVLRALALTKMSTSLVVLGCA